jgi:hypothetical protein
MFRENIKGIDNIPEDYDWENGNYDDYDWEDDSNSDDSNSDDSNTTMGSQDWICDICGLLNRDDPDDYSFNHECNNCGDPFGNRSPEALAQLRRWGSWK